MRTGWIVIVLSTLFVILGCAKSEPPPLPVAPTITPAPTATLSPTLTPTPIPLLSKPEVYQLVNPAVVRIKTSDTTTGSGVFISENGLILTNYHVVEGHERVSVFVQDELTIGGYVASGNKDLDLAIVKVGGGPWQYLQMTEYRPEVGEDILVIGYALNYDGDPTMTSGIVSQIRNTGILTWVQTDAPINPGTSGGAAVTMRGEFFAIPTARNQNAHRIGFLIAFLSVGSDIEHLMQSAEATSQTKPFP